MLGDKAGAVTTVCLFLEPVASLLGLGLCSALALVTASPWAKPVCCFESNLWQHLMEEGSKTQG